MPITINASEKDIEDVLCQHMKHYLGLRFVGRQINTPAGIIDILALAPNKTYYIIELKRGDITASAYAQAMRYCHYFNSTKSKDGIRMFSPLLVGESLSEEMVRTVRVFENGGESACEYSLIPEYRLFNFDPLKGLSFSFFSRTANDYYETYLGGINYIQRKIDEVECGQIDDFLKIERLKKELQEIRMSQGQEK